MTTRWAAVSGDLRIYMWMTKAGTKDLDYYTTFLTFFSRKFLLLNSHFWWDFWLRSPEGFENQRGVVLLILRLFQHTELEHTPFATFTNGL